MNRLTKEELAEIREWDESPMGSDRVRWEVAAQHRRKLLAELDAVTRERDEARADRGNPAARLQIAKEAEQRGYERCQTEGADRIEGMAMGSKLLPGERLLLIHAAEMLRALKAKP